jgi:branched-chain amino acid transport system substrate-binding protein
VVKEIARMPSKRHTLVRLFFSGLASLTGIGSKAAAAEGPLRIGMIATYSGPYADYGRQFDAGVALFLQERGGKIDGRQVEILKRDTGGSAADKALAMAQDLVTHDRIDILTGLDFSPNAYAVAPVATQSRLPTLIMNASSSGITAASPFIARLSFTVQQVSDPMARWMLRNGIRECYTLVADYAPGLDAETAFENAFTSGDGRIVGSTRTPLGKPDFPSVVQRIKAAKPKSVFFFFPSGVLPQAFLKAWKDAGMNQSDTRLFATGEATDDGYLQATGDLALGLITSHHYSYAHPSPKNQRFVKDFAAAFGPTLRPSYFAVTAYDAMVAIELALARTKGELSGNRLMDALRGLRFESPRGPIEIDPATRDIVQTVYIRKTERVEGQWVNTEFDRFDRVKDPAKMTLR